MTRPVFGQPVQAAVPARALPILQQCQRPAATYGRWSAGEPAPCYRCLALDAHGACHFIERRSTP